MALVNTRRGAVPPFRCLPPGRGCAGGAGARSVDSSPAERRKARDPVPRRGARDDMAQWIAAVRARALPAQSVLGGASEGDVGAPARYVMGLSGPLPVVVGTGDTA